MNSTTPVLVPGKHYRTRSGRKVIVYAIYPESKEYPVHGAYRMEEEGDKEWDQITWELNGKFYAPEQGSESGLDIVAEWKEPVTVKGWVNVYNDASPMSSSVVHKSREVADRTKAIGRIACVYVEGTAITESTAITEGTESDEAGVGGTSE